ncbi:MAG: hypothetical protein WCS09_07135 [Pseudomonadota bacterium]
MTIKMKSLYIMLISVFMISGCVSSVNVAVDPASIKDHAKFKEDYQACQDLANTYDLSSDTAANAALGATAGAVGVAGIATAIAGAVFWPAIPFIVAGGVMGGGVGGGITSQRESEARENIFSSCLNDRGYRAFGSARVR